MTSAQPKQRVVVEIEPPTDLIDRARERAGDEENVEAHLLDEYLFEFDWIGVGEGTRKE